MQEEQAFHNLEISYNRPWLEQVLLQLGDLFEIRIVWDCETTVLTSAFAVAGVLIGGYAGGRIGATVGAGIGGAAGYGVSTVVSLREVWQKIKDQLQEVLYIIYNYLRRLDHRDYVEAFKILMRCANNRRELVETIIEFIAVKLSKEVLSNVSYRALQ